MKELMPRTYAAPASAWTAIIALFLICVLIITILFHVSNPTLAIGLGVIAAFTAVEAAGQIFRRDVGPRDPLLLKVARALLAASSTSGLTTFER